MALKHKFPETDGGCDATAAAYSKVGSTVKDAYLEVVNTINVTNGFVPASLSEFLETPASGINHVVYIEVMALLNAHQSGLTLTGAFHDWHA